MEKKSRWTTTPKAERLKEARLSRGLTMTELAQKLNISRQAISKYEKNVMSPSHEIIRNMSDILEFPESFFFKDFDNDNIRFSPTYYRSLKTTENAYKKMFYMRLEWARRLIGILEDFLNLPTLNIPEALDSSCEIADEKTEEMASSLRKFWGLGLNPISDLTRLVEANGIFVSRINYGATRIDACSKISDSRAYIMLSEDKASAVRSRFDLAHELGHFLLHRDWTDDEYEEHFNLVEKQAHQFAGALLMPRETFTQEIYSTSLEHLIELKRRWKVSLAAIIYRCSTLELFSEGQVQRLRIELGRRKWKRVEPLDDVIPAESPVLIRKALELLFTQQVISPTEIMNVMGISEYDFSALCNIDLSYFKSQDENKKITFRLIGSSNGIKK